MNKLSEFTACDILDDHGTGRRFCYVSWVFQSNKKKVPYFQIDTCNVQHADAIFIYSDNKKHGYLIVQE